MPIVQVASLAYERFIIISGAHSVYYIGSVK